MFLLIAVALFSVFSESESREGLLEDRIEILESSIKGDARYLFTVTLDRRPVLREEAYSVALVESARIGDRHFALIEVVPNDSHCQALYRVLELDESGKEFLSPLIGSCNEKIESGLSARGFRLVAEPNAPEQNEGSDPLLQDSYLIEWTFDRGALQEQRLDRGRRSI